MFFLMNVAMPGFAATSSQSAAFLARATNITSNSDKIGYDRYITGLVADGIFAKTQRNSVRDQREDQHHREDRDSEPNHGYDETQTLAAFQLIASKDVSGCLRIVRHRRFNTLRRLKEDFPIGRF